MKHNYNIEEVFLADMSPSRNSEYTSNDKKVIELEYLESVNMYCLRFWKPETFEGSISYHEYVISGWNVHKEEWFNSETIAKRKLRDVER